MTAGTKRLCVFCGSSAPPNQLYRNAALQLGTLLGRHGIGLVYGGGRVGLMGILADAALEAGGHVIGVIPAYLHDREIGHRGINELVVVRDMHERKRRMFELSDAVAILPGGLGTLDEAFEAITLHQLGLMPKPIVLLNIGGMWEPLLTLIDHTINEGFTRPEARALYHVVAQIEDVLPACFDPA